VGDHAPFATQLEAAPAAAAAPTVAPPAAPAPVPATPTAPRPIPAPDWTAWLAPASTALVTLAVTLWRIGVPSLWRDEGATLSAVHRSFPQLIRMLGQMDAVHGLYYVLMWLLVRLAGSGELALRLPSALAMATAAGLLTLLGRRLVSGAAGIAAGLAFAAIPVVSWFGQDARPFALETAIATAATYSFVRMSDEPPRHRWTRWYTASLIALGLANIFGLLLIAAHGLTLVVLRGRAGHPVARRWLAAVTVAVVVLLPLELLAWAQRGQVRWLRTPRAGPLAGPLADTGRLIGAPRAVLAVAVIMAAALAVTALAGRARFRAAWPGRLAAVGLPWLVLPSALLIAAAQLDPVYTFRYVVFCAPAAALLIGAGLAALGRVAGPAALALIVLLGLPAQLGERGPDGHSDNIRAMDQIIARNARPGDAVVYPQGPGMVSFAAAYPYGLARLHNLSAGQSPAQADTISGTNAPLAVVRTRLSRVSRVWVAEADRPWPGRPLVLRRQPFELIHKWQVSDIWLWLYHREDEQRQDRPRPD
jgi:mannosyltransferase